MSSTSPQLNIQKTLQFFHLIHKLKHLPRTGWILASAKKSQDKDTTIQKQERIIENVESVASHMYRMALMFLTMPSYATNGDPSQPIDVQRCILMSLVHDLGESIVGDITPHDGVSEDDKFRMEEEAMKRICDMVHEKETSQLIMDLWMEYENQNTREARLVKEVDRFDMVIQANEYEKEYANEGLRLDGFFESTKGKFQNSYIKEIDDHIRKEREERYGDK